VSCNGACEQPRVSYLETTTITVTVTDELGCTSEMSVLVEVLDQIPEIFVPSGFTPNADGSNDVFQVYGQGIEYMTLSIFDRWGKMIHQITDQKESWNGNYVNGKPAPTGTYVYILEIEYLSEMGIPLPKPVTGNVTLLRN
jgi:gliding motility-associated-like protein